MKRFLIIIAILVAAFIFGDCSFAGNQTTSSTAGSTLTTRIRYYLNESTASFWSDAEILAWINDGQRDIVARTHCLEGKENETIITGTYEYAIGSSYITVEGVTFTTSTSTSSLKKGSIEHMGDTMDVGQPAYYFTWDNNLVVYPVPDSGVSGTTLTIYYIEMPTDLTSGTSTIVVPKQFDRALLLYAVSQALFKDEKFAKAGRFMAEYLAELDRYRLDFSYQKPAQEIR